MALIIVEVAAAGEWVLSFVAARPAAVIFQIPVAGRVRRPESTIYPLVRHARVCHFSPSLA